MRTMLFQHVSFRRTFPCKFHFSDDGPFEVNSMLNLNSIFFWGGGGWGVCFDNFEMYLYSLIIWNYFVLFADRKSVVGERVEISAVADTLTKN